MKKFVMLGLALFGTACPVACVNDPTDSEATCLEATTSTATDVCKDVGTDVAVEDSTATGTEE